MLKLLAGEHRRERVVIPGADLGKQDPFAVAEQLRKERPGCSHGLLDRFTPSMNPRIVADDVRRRTPVGSTSTEPASLPRRLLGSWLRIVHLSEVFHSSP